MKTLRLLRNAAALFIIAMALFRPGVQPCTRTTSFAGTSLDTMAAPSTSSTAAVT